MLTVKQSPFYTDANRPHLHMFSRDSQFARDRKLPNNAPLSRDSNLASTPSSKTTAAKGTIPKGIDTASLLSELPERSQSWQIAPNLFSSFKYAWAGISYAFQTQRNFRIHTAVGTVAMVLCWTLKVTNIETAVICLTIGAVLVMEILNTALESLVDLTVGQTYHELAKIAKDCAAGAVLMAAIVAMIIAALIFAPPAWALISPLLLAG